LLILFLDFPTRFETVRRGCDRMVVGFTTIYANTNVVSSNPVHGEVYSIQHYVIKKVCQLTLNAGLIVLWDSNSHIE